MQAQADNISLLWRLRQATDAINVTQEQPMPQRTRIKICGITRSEDARTVVDSGADAIGLVFYPRSPRAISVAQAADIAAAVAPFVTLVGLFVNADADSIREVLQQVPLGLLQFHGDETEQQCQQFDRPYIKAIRMRPQVNRDTLSSDYPSAQALLLDAYTPGAYGGTGEQFSWQRIPTDLQRPIILAGGLNAANVASAISQVHPYAVDVSGGVEADKGIKDAAQVHAFVHAAQQADHAVQTNTSSQHP
jgi:phosphoribosylanthranilate isomerase